MIMTKCSEKMPPSDLIIIAKTGAGPYQVGTGSMLDELFRCIESMRCAVDPTWQWTPYSDELWQSVKPK